MINFTEWMKLQEVTPYSSKADDEKFALSKERNRMHADSEEEMRKNSELSDDDPKKYRDITNKPGFNLRKKKMKKK